MESAFVDIGEERSAFFYIDDILPESLENEVAKASEGKIPIDKLLSEGQDVIVQVSKGPISTKGARITSHISLPGRNLVYMPFSNTVGVSRQITDDSERVRLRDIVSRLRPQNAGFIIRTVAEGRSEEDLHSDINFLVSLWDGVLQRAKKNSSPSLLHTDLNVVYRTLRDSLSKEVRKLVVNEREEYRQIRQFVKSYLPKFYSLIEYYGAAQPIFDHFGIENEIERALGHKVWLPSGGSLIIDQTEALTAIDVNTGRFVGKESHEQTILRTNLEAVEEIVHQLQLRNIGGIIIIELDATGLLMDNLANSLVLVLVVLFQADIRNALAQFGLITLFRDNRAQQQDVAERVLAACRTMARRKIGALVVFEKEVGLRNFTDRGTPINGLVSESLLLSIFHPTSPLHDGAVILGRKGDLVAAKCILPVSMNQNLSTMLGTRHRAALGLTEETDAVVLIVSEERKEISLGFQGQLMRESEVDLKQMLFSLLSGKTTSIKTKKTPAEEDILLDESLSIGRTEESSPNSAAT
jgi:Rne/Rng family ribonuclease